MRKFLIFILSVAWSAGVSAAPIVVTPGDVASYMYFPAGGGSVAAATNSTSEPVGFIAMFPKAPPDGWLECTGATIQAADYPDLVLFLTGNPSATVAALPNMRAAFLRGWDNGRGLDAGRGLKTIQGGNNLSHVHAASSVSTAGAHTHAVTLSSVGSHTHAFTGTQFINNSIDSDHMDRSGTSLLTNSPSTSVAGAHAHSFSSISTDGAHSHAMSVTATGGTEARPRNVAVIFAIKAEN